MKMMNGEYENSLKELQNLGVIEIEFKEGDEILKTSSLYNNYLETIKKNIHLKYEIMTGCKSIQNHKLIYEISRDFDIPISDVCINTTLLAHYFFSHGIKNKLTNANIIVFNAFLKANMLMDNLDKFR